GRVAYSGVYPGIDLAYYAKGNQVEYDFVVAPGADPSVIRLGIEGADSLRLDKAGNLVMATAAGELTQHKPVLYQDVDGVRRPVEGSFLLEGTRLGFSVGPYDPTLPLVIDPILAYSTYIGGSGGDFPTRIAVGNDGSAYIAGTTVSPDFPTTAGALRTSRPDDGLHFAFVSKLNREGTGLLYSTFVATATNAGVGLAVAEDGSAWVSGTSSFTRDVPVTAGAFLTTRPAGAAAFLVKLSPSGRTAAYGTYFTNPSGAGSVTHGGALAVEPSGDVWIAATSNLNVDPPFPTTPGAVQPTCSSIPPRPGRPRTCASDILLAKIHPGGRGLQDLVYATYLGGTGSDTATSFALGADGAVLLFGDTNGAFPTTPGALMPTYAGGGRDTFLSRIRPAGNGSSDLLYSTYFGGLDTDGSSSDMALAADGTAYVTFSTDSFDVPITPGAYRPFRRDQTDVVVARINPAGGGSSDLLYSTLVPSDGIDQPFGIAVDGRGHAFVTGHAGFNFETRNPLECCPFDKGPQDQNFGGDAFVFELNPAGEGDADMVFSTFLGGATGIEIGRDIAVGTDTAGTARAAYVVGDTPSTDFPVTTGSFQTTNRGGKDGFVSKIDVSDTVPCTRTLTGNVIRPITVQAGEEVCLNDASVSGGLTVEPGGAVRIRNSRIAGSVVSHEAAFFALCGTTVSRDLTVSDTSPQLVQTEGEGCAPNTVVGASAVPGASGSTDASPAAAEPGDTITASGFGLTPATSYRLLMGTTAENCRTSSVVLGGNVVSTVGGAVGPVARTIPTNTTSGTRYVCWVQVGNSDNAADADSLTIV
ncbi:MAG: SBBP repeat-containing protein, partial [Actinobacteria bacterium]|nr:SBBP repeat-containing protein [Actinomycetota bacterium]